jgi:glycosyltransferase involved in cell wall biosynthesis
VLAISDAYAWPVPASLKLPRPGPRVVAVPCINGENDRRLRSSVKDLAEWRRLLDRADVAVHSSRSGYDARLHRSLGVLGAYVPNATEEVAPAGSLRARLGIGAHERMLLVVANFFPLKNHAGLLEAVAGRPGEYHLVFAGHPAPAEDQDPEETARLEALVAREPRLHLAGGLAPELVAAAMEEADLLLLPSLNEATPLVLLEAMSRALPWIATPACGAAVEWAGGLIAPAERFGEAIDHLLARPEATAALGAAGREHWRACFTLDAVARRYDALLRGADGLPDLPPPAGAIAATDRERAGFYDRAADRRPAAVA